MLHKTAAIVLRTVKYGETSLVATLFTEKFGLQTYMINGIRATKAKNIKGPMFQPGAQLIMEVYHQPQKNMQRIKECSWKVIYQHLFSHVIKNSVALFMVELLQRALKQPEENELLFAFMSDALLHLDKASIAATANYPLFFALNLPHFFGFELKPISNKSIPSNIQNENFLSHQPGVLLGIDGKNEELLNDLLSVRMPEELEIFKISSSTRNLLLNKIILYYQQHIADFGELRTLPILRKILA